MNGTLQRIRQRLITTTDRLVATVRRVSRGEEGMVTAEYAVGMLAACALAAVMFRVVTGEGVFHALTRLVTSALDTQR